MQPPAAIPPPPSPVPSPVLDNEAPVRVLGGFAGRLVAVLAAGLSLYALYWVLFIIQPQIYRASFLLIALVLTFLVFPLRRGDLRGVAPPDWILAGVTLVALSWPIYDFDAFIYRAADPRPIDMALGLVTIALVLEATRRSVGGILPATALGSRPATRVAKSPPYEAPPTPIRAASASGLAPR